MHYFMQPISQFYDTANKYSSASTKFIPVVHETVT
jgi:hypothetical protein